MTREQLLAALVDEDAIVLSALFHCVPVMRQAAEHIRKLETALQSIADNSKGLIRRTATQALEDSP